ncbi:MAG: type II secretion system F family protein [Candidatus Eremiobacterota bacterium]
MTLILFIITGTTIIVGAYYLAKFIKKSFVAAGGNAPAAPVKLFDFILCFTWDSLWYDSWGILRGRGLYTDLYLFNNKLLQMLRLNLPLSHAVSLILGEGFGPSITLKFSPLQRPLRRVLRELQRGNSFSASLKKERFFIPYFYINMIETGERQDNLIASVEVLDGYLKSQKEYISYYAHTISYTLALVFIAFAVVLFNITYIMPTFVDLFEGMDVTLPVYTKMLIYVTKLWRNPVTALPVNLIIFGVILLILFHRCGLIRNRHDRIYTKIPFFSSLIRNHEYIIFCRVMSGLLKNFMPLDKAIKIVADAMGLYFYSYKLSSVILEPSLRNTLDKTGIFDDTFLFMVSLGEKTENLPDVFNEMAEYYEHDYAVKIKNLFKILEVLLTLLIGLFIGWAITGMFSPIVYLVVEMGNGIFK